MDTLIREINALIRLNLNDIVLKSENEDCLSALDDYCHQIENYLDVLDEIIQALGKGVRRLRREKHQFTALVSEAERSERQFNWEGQQKLARAARKRGRVLRLAASACLEEGDRQNARFLSLMDSKLQLEARLTEVTQKRIALQEQAQDMAVRR